MLKHVLLLCAFVVAFACKNENAGSVPPPDLIDKNQMAEVMADLALAEAVISVKTLQNPAFTADSLVKFNVFKQHGISRKQYQNSIDYYSAHPQEFKEVYDLVLKKIEGIKK